MVARFIQVLLCAMMRFLTEDHLGAARRLCADAINSKIGVEDATRNAKHSPRRSTPVAMVACILSPERIVHSRDTCHQ